MCGICGFVYEDGNHPVDEGRLRAMMAKLSHRGPDESGVFLGAGGREVALGHTRLSVIDLETGTQPMRSEHGRGAIVYNGEVYNFQELRREMESRGKTFRTHSDTEVILRLYEEEHERTCAHLNGQFAFAVWDDTRRELFLARDRLGEKPLFYHHAHGRFVFASSIEALLEAGDIPREIDPVSLEIYLTFGYIPAPRTIFRDVRKLPCGCSLTVRSGQLVEKRYWSPAPGPTQRLLKRGEIEEELRRLLTDSVRMRLISDVPLGAFLSGGVDSSIVVGLMSGVSSEPVRTFTIGFGEALYDERAYASEVAGRCRTRHREFLVEPKSAEALEKLVSLFGEPFADSSAIPTYLLSRETRAHVKVALSGDGGDELFGGYDRYRAMLLSRVAESSPKFVRRMVRKIAARRTAGVGEPRSRSYRVRRFLDALERDPVERYIAWVSVFDAAGREALTSEEFRRSLDSFRGEEYLREHFSKQGTGTGPDAAMAVDLETYLPHDLLVKTDVASMAWGLEVRCPFLDHRLVEFARSIPVQLKLSALRGKRILRHAFRDLLPGSVRRRRKMGFGVPLGRWFRGELKGMTEDMLVGGKTSSRGILRPDAVRTLVEEHASSRADHSAKLYALLFLELWFRKFMD
jgi:asparagine synthase (glutamine-hydrolysing)